MRLADNFGILFNSLFTITNMPIKRFADFLHRRRELEEYMNLLVRNFNKDTVENLMCLDTVSGGSRLLVKENMGWNHSHYRRFSHRSTTATLTNSVVWGLFLPAVETGLGVTGDRTAFDIGSLDDLLDVRVRTNALDAWPEWGPADRVPRPKNRFGLWRSTAVLMFVVGFVQDYRMVDLSSPAVAY